MCLITQNILSISLMKRVTKRRKDKQANSFQAFQLGRQVNLSAGKKKKFKDLLLEEKYTVTES